MPDGYKTRAEHLAQSLERIGTRNVTRVVALTFIEKPNAAYLCIGKFSARVSIPRFAKARRHSAPACFGNRIQHVISLRPKKKMVWPGTAGVVAAMKDAHAGRNRTVMQFPGKAVGSIAPTKLTVTRAVFWPGPQPAILSFLDPIPESFYRVKFFHGEAF